MKLSDVVSRGRQRGDGERESAEVGGDDPDAEYYEGKMQPVFHILTHYPTMMSRLGPLLPLSSMRPEGKHKFVKKALTSISSSINPPFSASKKVQLSNMSMIVNNQLPPRVHALPNMRMIENIEDGSLRESLSSSVQSLRQVFNLPPTVKIRHIPFVPTSESVRFSVEDGIYLGIANSGYPAFAEIIRFFCSVPSRIVYVEVYTQSKETKSISSKPYIL